MDVPQAALLIWFGVLGLALLVSDDMIVVLQQKLSSLVEIFSFLPNDHIKDKTTSVHTIIISVVFLFKCPE